MRHIVVDSGASKAEWVYFDGEQHHSILTSGIHPASLDSTDAFEQFKHQFTPFSDGIHNLPFDAVYYFGTGCADHLSKRAIKEKLVHVFSELLPPEQDSLPEEDPFYLYVSSDIEGAAKAVFPSSEGLLILLGTGSIFAHVRQGDILQRIPSLGYLLGDEGSAAYLGKKIYSGYYREVWSPETLTLIKERTGFVSYADQMQILYSHSHPSAHFGKVAQQVFSDPMTEELLFVLKQELIAGFTLAKELIYRNEERGQRRDVLMRTGTDAALALPIACSGGVILSHPDVARECAELVFQHHPLSFFSSVAVPVSQHLAEGKLTIKHVD